MTDAPPVRIARPGSLRLLLAMAAMTAIALVAAFISSRSINPLRGDSAEYLYFDPSRTVGYPAFLWLVQAVTGKVSLAVPVQLIFVAASLLYMGWSFQRVVGRPAVALLFYMLVVAQAGMWFLSAFLMTEALATALVTLWSAELLRLLKRPDSRLTFWPVLLSAVATMVRPSLLPLFFGTALFYFLTRSGKALRSALIMTAAGVAVAWVATPVAQLIVHGSMRTTSPLARGVLQHTLYCPLHALPSDADSLFVEEQASPVRRYIEVAPAAMREQFRRSFSTPLRFGLIIPVLGRRHHFERRSDVDRDLSRIATERVRANPSCYTSSVAGEYFRLATFNTDPTSEDAAAINAFIKDHPPPDLPQYPVLRGDEQMARRAASDVREKPAGLNSPRFRLDVVGDVPFMALLPMRLLCAAASLIGLVSLLCVPLRQGLPPVLREFLPLTAAMGLAFHGTLAGTALVEIGFYRYLVPFWPLICALAVIGLFTIVKAYRSKRAEPTP